MAKSTREEELLTPDLEGRSEKYPAVPPHHPTWATVVRAS
jgi:hypothetical protein